jgi:hypothetical protein
MHSYKAGDLYNFYLQQEADEAVDTGILSNESNEGIKKKFPCNLYTPNFFIRIALSLLCLLCATFATALLFLILDPSSDTALPVVFFFMFCVCYGLLEYLVKQKNYFNAGIDNVLQVFTIIFFAGMFIIGSYTYQDLSVSLAVWVCAIWLCIRFTDSFMALIAYAASMLFLCFACNHAGKTFILYFPFIAMAASAFTYLIQRSLRAKKQFGFYKKCFNILRLAALSGFYISCNAYIIVQLNNTFFPENTVLGKPYFILLLAFDVIIPALYIFYGSLKKRLIFLRSGVITLAATIATLFYFYPFVSGEIWLITSGLLMILAGYTAMRLFKKDRYGFTSNSSTDLQQSLINVQVIINVQAGYKGIPDKGVEFGGGSSGGAGSTGNW